MAQKPTNQPTAKDNVKKGLEFAAEHGLEGLHDVLAKMLGLDGASLDEAEHFELFSGDGFSIYEQHLLHLS